MNRRRRLESGFTITELLIALGVLALFAVAATQLFYATMRLSRTSAERQDAASQFDSAVGALRADVWSAGEIAAPDSSTARVGNVTWTVKDHTLTRDAGDSEPQRRWEVPPGVTFAAEPAALVLRVARSPGEPGGDVRMVSQSLVLARLKS
jgi:prepilin-type N-terminal cleavage/methylation domain-containing protein